MSVSDTTRWLLLMIGVCVGFLLTHYIGWAVTGLIILSSMGFGVLWISLMILYEVIENEVIK